MMLHPYPLNLSHSLHPFLTFPPQLQPQPLFSTIKSQPSNKACFQPYIRAFFKCHCSSSFANLDTEFAKLVSFFQELGIGFEETKVLFLNNPDLSLVSVDSLHARVLSLQSLGLDRVAMYQLVTKRPTVLTDKKIVPLLSFLRNELEGQLEQAQIERLLSLEPKFLVDFPQKVKLLVERGVPADKIVHVLNKVHLQKALCGKSMDEIDRFITFLEPFGSISLILRLPTILKFDLDKQLIPRIKVLVELSNGDKFGVAKVLLRYPAILNYTVKHVEGHLQFLRSFANLDDKQIFRIMSIFPAVVTISRERKLRPRIQFLMECGLDSDDIFKFLIKAPLFLGHSFHDNIVYKLVFLVKIGYKYKTKDLAMAIGISTRTSCENMQKVISLFLNYGFSCEDIIAMSKKQPQILQYNHTSLETKMNYLIEDMDRDIKELLVFPAFLGYKLDDRIKPRYEIRKSTKGGQMSLNKLLTVSSEMFTDKRKKASALASEL
ncbi:Transcription termination factor, mitochondrial/chloroplastic [Sesbania bispinosa]|nr:Transcription termination factor, mitochondrial/chloroplastic [Sesbania bispinosa]